jgi:putative transposase
MQIEEGKYKNKYRVKSTRLPNWDYANSGYYFVTICTKDRECFFGDVIKGKMILSTIGKMADGIWQNIHKHFLFVRLDEYIIMPNHVHGIIIIENEKPHVVETRRAETRRAETRRAETRRAETRRGVSLRRFGLLPKNSLASVINHYKGGVKKWGNKNGFPEFSWQANYYDRVIRHEEELNRIRQYIIDNPLKWEIDRDNTGNLFM